MEEIIDLIKDQEHTQTLVIYLLCPTQKNINYEL